MYLDTAGFTDIETPMLTKSTPEGARDYLVPSRIVPGCFYALPQSPQQYKQLLMLAGMDRYYQIARCFRDEDLRADRQPEFTQIDMEMSFITPEDVYEIIDGMLAALMKAAGHGDIQLPLPRMKYDDAMNRYGSDKPDLRFGMEIVDVSDVFKETKFNVFAKVLAKGGVVKAINAKGLGLTSLSVMDDWTAHGKGFRARRSGLYPRVAGRRVEVADHQVLLRAEKQGLTQKLGIAPGDLILFGADTASVVNVALGRLRLIAGEAAGVIAKDKFAFTWITDFPLFEKNDEGQIQSMHHPFTSPHLEDLDFLESDPLQVRAQAYDIVLNGTELGGGSIRIHDSDLQARMFGILGNSAGRNRRPVRPSDSRLRLRRAAARRHRAGPRPARHADGRRRIHPRRHRLPEDAEGHGPDDERAGEGRRAPVERHPHSVVPAAGRTKKLAPDFAFDSECGVARFSSENAEPPGVVRAPRALARPRTPCRQPHPGSVVLCKIDLLLRAI